MGNNGLIQEIQFDWLHAVFVVKHNSAGLEWGTNKIISSEKTNDTDDYTVWVPKTKYRNPSVLWM